MTTAPKNRVNRSELASVFGIAPTTVDAWVKAGCPYVERPTGRGKGWLFDTAAVSKWREQVAADAAAGKEVQDEAALRLRKLAAEARAAELKLLQEVGAVASLEAMERAWTRMLAEFQSRLRGEFITRCERQLLGEDDSRTFKRVLLSEVDVTLSALADMDPGDRDDSSIPAMGGHA